MPAFRGAIIEKVDRSHILFHHHQDDTTVLYQYPLIQYKSIQKSPGIVCLGDGAVELYRLMSQPDLKIKLHDKPMNLVIDSIEMKQHSLKLLLSSKSYRIVNWLALNTKNLERFNACDSPLDKVALLERILKGNILSFAKGIDWHITDNILLNILEVKDQRIIRFKGRPVLAFDLIFEANILLPNFIGLGKSASHGYGMIHSQKI